MREGWDAFSIIWLYGFCWQWWRGHKGNHVVYLVWMVLFFKLSIKMLKSGRSLAVVISSILEKWCPIWDKWMCPTARTDLLNRDIECWIWMYWAFSEEQVERMPSSRTWVIGKFGFLVYKIIIFSSELVKLWGGDTFSIFWIEHIIIYPINRQNNPI